MTQQENSSLALKSVANLVAAQYQRWPYPDIPLLSSVRALNVWQLHLDYLRDRCGFGKQRSGSRIWLAGCGTFQPYVFAIANPNTSILATDLSKSSLEQARKRCRIRGLFNVKFEQVDLEKPESWPEGSFELIECYGVLMNLKNPAETLKKLAERLAPAGILRLMVYPYFSRRRIFQVQRVASLLGFTAFEPTHPRRLREGMLSLPEQHPLYYAVSSYKDSENDAGMVDGFLHQGDRGFTALELGNMALDAGLVARFWVHRPWAQPATMASLVGAETQTEVLDTLDRWQELRTNLVVCLVKEEYSVEKSALRLHPLLAGTEGRGRLNAWAGRLLGLKLESRTSEGNLRYSGAELRALAAGRAGPELKKRALEDGVLLGEAPVSRLPFHRLVSEPNQLQPRLQLEVGRQVANPFYDHLFAAWRSVPEALLAVMEHWKNIGEPLEEKGQFGLTPVGSWEIGAEWISDWWERWREGEIREVAGYERLRFADERKGWDRVWKAVKAWTIRREFSEIEQRELWVLLGSWGEFLVDSEEI